MEVIPQIKDQLLTFSQASKLFPYSKDYLNVMARRGVIPAFKLKRNWVIFKTTLEEYHSKHEK